MSKDFLDDYQEVRSNWIKFNTPGDYIKGILIDVFKPTTPDQWGKMKKTFILKAIEGSFHGNDENKVVDKVATIVEAGSDVRVGLNDIGEGSMQNIKIGQKVLIKLKELKPTKKGNPAKIYGILQGPMDEDFLKEINASKQVDEDFKNA